MGQASIIQGLGETRGASKPDPFQNTDDRLARETRLINQQNIRS